MGVSIREFARQMGLKSDNSVRRAIEAGRITLLPDKTIDPVAAKRQWDANTFTAKRRGPAGDAARGADAPAAAVRRGPGRPKGGGTPPRARTIGGKADAAPRAAAQRPDDLSTVPSGLSADEYLGMSMADLQTLLAAERLREARLKNALLDGSQCLRAPMLLIAQSLSRETREAFQQFTDKHVSNIAATLGIEDRESELYVAIRRAMDKHLTDSVGKIDIDKHLARIA